MNTILKESSPVSYPANMNPENQSVITVGYWLGVGGGADKLLERDNLFPNLILQLDFF
jgi:hypothetical protein